MVFGILTRMFKDELRLMRMSFTMGFVKNTHDRSHS